MDYIYWMRSIRRYAQTVTFPNMNNHYDPDYNATIKFLNQILLEDNMDENDLSMSYDPIALRAVENSFYNALCQNPSSPYQGPLFYNNNSDRLHCTFGSSGYYSTTGSTVSSFDTSQWIVDPEDPKSSLAGDPPEYASHKYNTNSTLRKKHNLPDRSGLEEERSRKFYAVYEEEVKEVELSEMFDKVLICADNIISDRFPSAVGGRKSRSLKKRDNSEFVDLETLLLDCARSIAASDHGSVGEKLKMIRKHSSPTGDASQRMAHVFANALEARLNGTGAQLSEALAPNKMSGSGFLKSFLISWPIARISYFIANKMIQEVALNSTSLHVIDFGIFYGIQWPTLIRDLSQRPAGPPKLRITGIEYPLCGFRPEQMVVETGRLLAKYCEQFGVPFEYNAITTKSWEKIKIDDLKLVRGEVVAVNCAFRLKNLMEGRDDSHRDVVLNLIWEITPHIFVPNVLNGSHSCNIFLSRFREAFLFYSNYFDMFDATLPRNCSSRLSFEQEFLGREIMNVVACEGMERVERPETYKQWHLRIMKAGFKPMPMNPDLVKKLKGKVNARYHKDFVFDEDGHWVLQGWKGRILWGVSGWVPHRTLCSFDTEESKSSLAGDPPSFHSSSVTNLDDYNTDSTRSKKHNLPDKSRIEEERSSKYSTVYDEEEAEDELSEMFDKVLICVDSIIADQFPSLVGCKGRKQNHRGGRKSHSKTQKDNTEFVDLETLLLSCARSIAAFDHGSAKEQLRNIRKYSSPTGDAYQRMAHAFANALEARLNGTGPQLSEGLAPNKMTGLLRSFMISWPVLRISYFIANKIIQEVASKCTSLHVIDFGIYNGIQWPTLIHDLSKRPTGPPKLKVTGIEYPVRGFCPEQLVVDTGRILAKYCKQFGVPFEYNAITSQNWEKIKIDDLKLVRGEVVAVNCAFRLRNLMDETLGEDNPSPRDAVLNLIREINPQVFVPIVLNASHSGPLFLSRFREAFLFYSNYFDMIDATVPHDDSRLRFEQEFAGREIMNVIACEGMERVERPGTYKQWQMRITKAGFKPMPMNQDLVKKLSGKVKAGYHKDFVFDEDGHWVLQGWKGRTLCGVSGWVPRRFT
ncbi:unnamed protein product [Cuscuta campestris]|uniref:Uncharacterized protein n=1 Tax=Cuscuta campestris TaxID=132261 RepID=A0A484MUC0_9ASTE|nr:unnamed protein product [Cuscuta campestris]